jgi:hypothetical protein
VRILFVGDVVGKPGRKAFRAAMPAMRAAHMPDLVIVNGENAAGGFGITEAVGRELFSIGAHVITTGNHVWDKREAVDYLTDEPRVLRPMNYPPGVPGSGSVVVQADAGGRVAVINAAGRVFMQNFDCPFRTVPEEVARLRKETMVIFIDFHAEATSEKIAFGLLLDGTVSAVVGTHTHVQTADERVLPGGTAYITDVGMTGPRDGVIGVDPAQVLDRFLTQMPTRFNTAEGPTVFSAVALDVDETTGRARSIERILIEG